MITSGQLRAARSLLRWSAETLAEWTGLGTATVRRAEAADGPMPITTANAEALRRALEAVGVRFIAQNGGGAGVRLVLPDMFMTEVDFVSGYRQFEDERRSRYDPTLELERFDDGKALKLLLARRQVGTASYRAGEVFFSPTIGHIEAAPADVIEHWISKAVSA